METVNFIEENKERINKQIMVNRRATKCLIKSEDQFKKGFKWDVEELNDSQIANIAEKFVMVHNDYREMGYNEGK